MTLDAMGDAPTLTNITVERLPAGDVDQVLALSRLSASHGLDARLEAEKPETSIWVTRPTASDPPASYLLVWWVADEAQVVDLATHPDARRQGHARRLLETLIDAARERGTRRLVLEVRADNSAALALYERIGFELCRRRPRYYRDGSDGLEMLLELSD